MGVRVDELTISRVEAIALAAPFDEQYPDGDAPDWLLRPAASHRVMPRYGQYATIVKVHTTDGLVGVGEAYGLPDPQVPLQIIGGILAPLLEGQDAFAHEAIFERLHSAQSGSGHTRGSFYSEAQSGVDLALWDLRGKALGLPVHRLLGGPIRTAIDCYASPVPFMSDVEESAAKAQEFVDEGFRSVKLKLGRGLDVDVAHATAVRRAIGPDVALLVDLNCAYSVDAATRVGMRLADLDVTWLEEPLAIDDLAGMAELRQRLPMTIVNGETRFTRHDFRESLLHRAVDVVMPNLTRSCGITGTRHIASLCESFFVDIAPHGVGSAIGLAAGLQLSAAIPNFRTYEYNRLPNPLREDLLTTKVEFRDGRLAVPDGPGLGIELDEDVVDKYTIAAISGEQS
jgi:D-arabinonate dehydratase/D-galactarolactone cycloisomerase